MINKRRWAALPSKCILIGLSYSKPLASRFIKPIDNGSASIQINQTKNPPNIAPKLCSDMHNEWINKNYDKVFEINLKLTKIHYALFIETSPGPVKYAAELLGLCSSKTRLPLTSIKDSTKNIIKESMREVGLL